MLRAQLRAMTALRPENVATEVNGPRPIDSPGQTFQSWKPYFDCQGPIHAKSTDFLNTIPSNRYVNAPSRMILDTQPEKRMLSKTPRLDTPSRPWSQPWVKATFSPRWTEFQLVRTRYVKSRSRTRITLVQFEMLKRKNETAPVIANQNWQNTTSHKTPVRI